MGCAPSHVAPQQEQELHAKRQVKKEVSFPSASVPATAKTSDVMDDDGSFRNAPGAVTELEVIAAQDLWAASIKRISAAYLAKSDFVKIAGDAAGELYAYGHHDVLFKPTKAADFQFRPSAEEAMSYFIGGRHSGGGYDEDGGFAINAGKGFKEVVFENHQISLNGNTAIAMGNYSFTCATTSEVAKVEYTFGYKRCGDGKVRIFLHHSSLPYQRQTGKQRRPSYSSVDVATSPIKDPIKGDLVRTKSFREGVIKADLNDFKFDDAPPAAKAPAVA